MRTPPLWHQQITPARLPTIESRAHGKVVARGLHESSPLRGCSILEFQVSRSNGVIAAVLPGRARLLVLVRWRARARARQARLPLSGVRARRPAIRATPRGPRRATSWSAPIPIQVECDNRNGARGQMSYVQYRGAIQMCRRCQTTIGGTSRVRRATNTAVLARAERCH